MTRRPDWPERLLRFVEGRTRRRFAWGRHDCALFAADWVKAATGEDPAAWFRGRYASDAEAAAALVEYLKGRRSPRDFSARLEAVATEILGPPLDGVLLARRGDVVGLVDDKGRLMLGVCLGLTVAAPGPRQGLVRARLRDCPGPAWRV